MGNGAGRREGLGLRLCQGKSRLSDQTGTGRDASEADIPSASSPPTSIRWHAVADQCRAGSLRTMPQAGADWLGASRLGLGAGPADTSPLPEQPNHGSARRMHRSREKFASDAKRRREDSCQASSRPRHNAWRLVAIAPHHAAYLGHRIKSSDGAAGVGIDRRGTCRFWIGWRLASPECLGRRARMGRPAPGSARDLTLAAGWTPGAAHLGARDAAAAAKAPVAPPSPFFQCAS